MQDGQKDHDSAGTDFAEEYTDFLKRTDLGVDRAYTGRGIGRQLMKTAHEIAGREKVIAVYLIAVLKLP